LKYYLIPLISYIAFSLLNLVNHNSDQLKVSKLAKNKLFSFFLFLMTFCCSAPIPVKAQSLWRETRVNNYYMEYSSIRQGKVEPLMVIRRSTLFSNQEVNDFAYSDLGDRWLRKGRFDIYPQINIITGLNGGHVYGSEGYVDTAPSVFMKSSYKIPPVGKYGIIFWMSFEKHSFISTNDVSTLTFDFDSNKEIGYYQHPEKNKNWTEYDIGDGGILLYYPSGEVALEKSNPIWGPGYTGQLLFSNKTPSFTFINIHHRFSDRWVFSYFHGGLNSALRDSTYSFLTGDEEMKVKLPLIKKYIVAHRLDFYPRKSIRVGVGESVIYGARNVELAYLLPVLPYWSIQHDLSDSDNLQWFADVDFVKKGLGRIYGAFYMDEWDLMNTFNREKHHNWFAYQAGISYHLPVLKTWDSLFRAEYTHLTPYVYVHKNEVNTFNHHKHYLGFWSGPNSDNVFISIEGKPAKNLWFQLYLQQTRRGEVNDSTVEKQYTGEHIDFLYHSYPGDPECKTILGFTGEFRISTFAKVDFDMFYLDWKQKKDTNNDDRYHDEKWDMIIKVTVGF